jgi:S-formylglutathione hydrolase FrmB
VNYALRYPDMFCACYAMSAWLGMNTQLNNPHLDPKSKFALLTKAVAELSAVKLLEAKDKEELKALHSVAWFIDCGDDDFLLEQSEELHMKMRHLRIPAQFRVRDGNHNWEYWHNALRLCLPFVSRQFK